MAAPDSATKTPFSYPIRMGIAAAAACMVSVPLSLGVTVIDRSVTKFANRSAPSLMTAMASGIKTVVRTPSKYADSLGSRKGVELVAGDVSDPQVQGPAPLADALPSARLAGGAAAHAAPLAW